MLSLIEAEFEADALKFSMQKTSFDISLYFFQKVIINS